ncbi:hypothetical protein LOK49_LG05G02387 [Camellia lanceoleosa]|uniref:Uncharacterized protein n=1 Tax=Camellia lanceoleosa TaxID=1840588 RepID=A0ACC0HKC1_9ERIC|nr:hypothetical protein LOK49_LG05G02387 [Camellia lanceoleosa]
MNPNEFIKFTKDQLVDLRGVGVNVTDQNGYEGSDGSNEDISRIEVNKEFARRYEHNKKREDLQKLEELKKKGLVEDSSDSKSDDEASSDESNEDELINPKKDLGFLNALIKVPSC